MPPVLLLPMICACRVITAKIFASLVFVVVVLLLCEGDDDGSAVAGEVEETEDDAAAGLGFLWKKACWETFSSIRREKPASRSWVSTCVKVGLSIRSDVSSSK